MKVNGMIIRQLRENEGLDQKSLCDITSISHAHLSLIENGHRDPSPGVVARIAKALDVAIVDLRDD